MLWERGRRERLRLSERLSETPRLSDSENNLSYAQLFLLADPFGERGMKSKISFGEFRQVMESTSEANLLDIRLDSTYQVGDSYVARMTTGNTPYVLLPSLAYRPDCSTLVTAPINGWPVTDDHGELRQGLSHYEHTSAFLELLQPERAAVGAHVIDVNYLMLLLVGFMAKHRTLLERERVRPPVFVKMRFGNMWRRIPYVDTSDYIDGIRRFGLPFIEESSILVPPGMEPDTLLRTEPKDWRKAAPSRPIVPSSIEIAIDALRALGVLDHLVSEGADANAVTLRLISVAYRAIGHPLEDRWDRASEEV